MESKSCISVYTSEKNGNDETGNGSYENPFKTVSYVLKNINENITLIYIDSNEENTKYELISKSQLKKNKKKNNKNKKINNSKENIISEEINLIEIKEDLNLPVACKTKIYELKDFLNKRIEVFGWIHNIRRQSKYMFFIILRDGTGFLQCIITNNLCKTNDALKLTTESSIIVKGIIKNTLQGKTSINSIELIVDYWQLIGHSPSGGMDSVLNKESHIDILLDNRHLALRGKTLSKIMQVRSFILQCFRNYFFNKHCIEITPPTLIQCQVEGGSNLFKIDYFGEEAYLTQSSQLYLETMLPVVGDSFCIAQSYRAESSRTRRHLAEYTHIEAEYVNIKFDNLIDNIEDMIIEVINLIYNSDIKDIVKELNPNFIIPTKSFKRLKYIDAIEYCNKNNILKDDNTNFKFGDDIPEMAERKITDKLNVPLMITHFPVELKSFYMQKCNNDNTITESVDLLVPGVGEILGGSMRLWKEKELIEGFKRENINISNYSWYIDQRKFGTCEHGGFGLGLERFLTWILGRHHIRDVVPYPRFVGRCKP